MTKISSRCLGAAAAVIRSGQFQIELVVVLGQRLVEKGGVGLHVHHVLGGRKSQHAQVAVAPVDDLARATQTVLIVGQHLMDARAVRSQAGQSGGGISQVVTVADDVAAEDE